MINTCLCAYISCRFLLFRIPKIHMLLYMLNQFWPLVEIEKSICFYTRSFTIEEINRFCKYCNDYSEIQHKRHKMLTFDPGKLTCILWEGRRKSAEHQHHSLGERSASEIRWEHLRRASKPCHGNWRKMMEKKLLLLLFRLHSMEPETWFGSV